MEVDQYAISNNPEGYRVICVQRGVSPNEFSVAGSFTKLNDDWPKSPPYGKLALEIISAIEKTGFYLSKTSFSNMINVNEITNPNKQGV